ncbi:MAG: GspH/FimT family pseudopilin [Proteobacteria bacterium]|nr:GspH/FimT family pseudopilin [Pseudomonadota bacterium]MDA0928861.1 GspH/FimT family pseudopilin [Pseudomonadota bacterium]
MELLHPIGRKADDTGFTLLELLFTLGILATLLGLALPGFKELHRNTEMDIHARELAQLLQVARVAAITRNSLVTLCRSAAGDACAGQWQDGILVFADYDGDRRIDADDEVIRYHQFHGFEGEVRWRAFQNRQYLQITPQGFTRYQNGNFTLCPADRNPVFARQLIINRSARVRFAQDGDADGIREDSRGRPLRCS